MSVYSGFATRGQENKYNFLLETLLVTLKKRIMKFYKQEECDENKFKLLIKKIYKKMYLLQKGKFMTPKYTSCYTDLIQTMSIQINYESMSDISSMMSQTFSLRKQKLNSTNDNEDQNLISRNILQSKRNLLQSHKNHATTINLSAFSLKKPYFNTISINNQEESFNEDKINEEKINRSSSLGVDQGPLHLLKQKIKLRKLQDLKNLRGTMHMPRVQDFLPKKQEIDSSFFRRPTLLDPPREHRGGYRRQKYSRAQINIEDI